MSNLIHKKRIKAEKNGERDRKVLHNLMNNAVHRKIMDRIDLRLVKNKKDYLKWTLKPSYMSQEIFGNDLVAIRKSKVALTLKPAQVGM